MKHCHSLQKAEFAVLWLLKRQMTDSCCGCELHGLCVGMFVGVCRLYGFKVHPSAYELQYQAAANFKARPTTHSTTSVNYTNNKR
jgi:hypothetical protein